MDSSSVKRFERAIQILRGRRRGEQKKKLVKTFYFE